MLQKRIIVIFLLIPFIMELGCTKLHEKVLDETSETGKTNQERAEGLISPVYGELTLLHQHINIFALQEISSDEAILPFRGGADWGDNGIYIALHQHNTTVFDPNTTNVWNQLSQGISRAILAIDNLQENDYNEAKRFISEARGLRAYYNMMFLDLFGVAFQKDDLNAQSVVLRGENAVNYIKSELFSIIPQLDDNVGAGRMTKSGAQGLLARLYLQSAVYRDIYASSFDFKQTEMDSVIYFCSQIINSGNYELSKEYFDIFDDGNLTDKLNKEIIFAVDERPDVNGDNRQSYFSLAGDQYPLPQSPGADGTDGPAITPDYYQSWVDAYAPIDPAEIDGRFFQRNFDTTLGCITAADYKFDRGILRGNQYGLIRSGGVFEHCANGDFKVGQIYMVKRNRPNDPLIFTEQIDFTTAGSAYNTGYRVSKYEFSPSTIDGRKIGGHALIILRLADVYLMRAEAYLRKSEQANGSLALQDVNTVRTSRERLPAPELTSINLEKIYRERGFELYWESLRRPDMIRFGKYEDSWTEKTDSDPNKRLFPIPQTAIDGAATVEGYLTQNQGY